MQKLPREIVREAIKQLKGWHTKEGKLFKRFIFGDFNTAFQFMQQVAELAEHFNHHPDWSNCYKTLDISLTTHDAGGITEKDIWLAGKLDGLSREMAEG